MTKKMKKKTTDLQKRPYKRKFRCQNPECRGFTDCPAYNSGKIYCQKCTVHRKTNGKLPSKQDIKIMKDTGRWKR